MEDEFQISFAPVFDYSEFRKTGFLSDCTLIVEDDEGEKTEYKAHMSVLSNSSKYFRDNLTSELQESSSHSITITHNPKGLFSKVLDFIYTGKINIEFDEIMCIYSFARFYTIDSLMEKVSNRIDEISEENIINLIRQCYDNELDAELILLEPRISKLYNTLSVAELSDELDVKTFINVLKGIKREEKSVDDFYKDVNTFLGEGYEYLEGEKESVASLFEELPNGKKSVQEKNPYWNPFK